MADPTETGGATDAGAGPVTDSGLDSGAGADTGPGAGVAATGEGAIGADSTGATSTDEPSFFDPSELSPDLLPAYKQMQRAFTQKTQELAKGRDKIRAYDAAINDPRGTIEMLSRQAGIPVSFGQATNGQGEPAAPEWQPNDWQEVLDRAGQEGYERAMRELRPVVGEMRKSQLERDLDDIFPEWRQYETEFAQALQDHPTLAHNAHALTRLATPQNVLDAKATQAALRKLEKRGEGNKSRQGSSRKVPETPSGPMTLQQSYELAVKQLTGQR